MKGLIRIILYGEFMMMKDRIMEKYLDWRYKDRILQLYPNQTETEIKYNRNIIQFRKQSD